MSQTRPFRPQNAARSSKKQQPQTPERRQLRIATSKALGFGLYNPVTAPIQPLQALVSDNGRSHQRGG